MSIPDSLKYYLISFLSTILKVMPHKRFSENKRSHFRIRLVMEQKIKRVLRHSLFSFIGEFCPLHDGFAYFRFCCSLFWRKTDCCYDCCYTNHCSWHCLRMLSPILKYFGYVGCRIRCRRKIRDFSVILTLHPYQHNNSSDPHSSDSVLSPSQLLPSG